MMEVTFDNFMDIVREEANRLGEKSIKLNPDIPREFVDNQVISMVMFGEIISRRLIDDN